VGDSAEASSLERDAFLMVHLYADDSMRQAGELSYQTLKVRYGEPHEDPKTIAMVPEYSFIGDVQGEDYGYDSATDRVDTEEIWNQ
jgi:hypothetical protein